MIVLRGAIAFDAEWDGERYALVTGERRPFPLGYTLVLRHATTSLIPSADRLPFATSNPRLTAQFPPAALIMVDGRPIVAYLEERGGVSAVAVREAVARPARTRAIR